MQETITILRATNNDSTVAHQLIHEYYDAVGVQQKDLPEILEGYLSDPASGLWIALVNDEPAGCVALKPLKIDGAAECKRLYVRPEFRRRGLAEALLDAMEADAAQRGLSWIYLDSKDDLEVAIDLYKHRGYEPCERYNDNPQATIFLRRRLAATDPVCP